MRIRITFSKSGPMQYVGHLDLHRSWERTFRRATLPLEYSQGFHPQPHLNLACALPVGFTSQCELLDAWLGQDFSIEHVGEAISTALPPGLELVHMQEVDALAPALPTQVTSAVYLITLLDDMPDLSDRLDRITSSEHLPRIRRGKSYDLRPLIEAINLHSPDSGLPHLLWVQLAARESATGRPEELLAEMGIKFENTHVHRHNLILTAD
jgi:radical SAM-linked protein